MATLKSVTADVKKALADQIPEHASDDLTVAGPDANGFFSVLLPVAKTLTLKNYLRWAGALRVGLRYKVTGEAFKTTGGKSSVSFKLKPKGD